jgi:hypothetical protein
MGHGADGYWWPSDVQWHGSGSGGGSDKHRAAGGRIPIPDGGSEGSQMRSADAYKIQIGDGGGYSLCVVVLRAARVVSYFPSFQIPISCSREFIYYAFILFLYFLD